MTRDDRGVAVVSGTAALATTPLITILKELGKLQLPSRDTAGVPVDTFVGASAAAGMGVAFSTGQIEELEKVWMTHVADNPAIPNFKPFALRFVVRQAMSRVMDVSDLSPLLPVDTIMDIVSERMPIDTAALASSRTEVIVPVTLMAWSTPRIDDPRLSFSTRSDFVREHILEILKASMCLPRVSQDSFPIPSAEGGGDIRGYDGGMFELFSPEHESVRDKRQIAFVPSPIGDFLEPSAPKTRIGLVMDYLRGLRIKAEDGLQNPYFWLAMRTAIDRQEPLVRAMIEKDSNGEAVMLFPSQWSPNITRDPALLSAMLRDGERIVAKNRDKIVALCES